MFLYLAHRLDVDSQHLVPEILLLVLEIKMTPDYTQDKDNLLHSFYNSYGEVMMIPLQQTLLKCNVQIP